MLPLVLFGAFVVVPLALIGVLIFASVTAPLAPDSPLREFASEYRLLEPQPVLSGSNRVYDPSYHVPSSLVHGGTWHVHLN